MSTQRTAEREKRYRRYFLMSMVLSVPGAVGALAAAMQGIAAEVPEGATWLEKHFGTLPWVILIPSVLMMLAGVYCLKLAKDELVAPD